MIGERQRGHSQRLGTLEQVRDLARAVQKAVMAVTVEMDKRPAGHRGFTRATAARTPPAPVSPAPWSRADPHRPGRSVTCHGEPATLTSLP